MKTTACYLLMFLLLSVSTIAKTETQEAHAHGVATLALALEDEVLEIQFESPAANLVGFEHSASSPEEKQAVKQTETLLESPELMFSFVGTRCSVKEHAVDISELMDSEHDHGHKHGHHHANDEGHSDITASYRFSCEKIESLKSVSIELFSQFPGIEKINAIWVIESGQGARLLSPDKNTLSLK